MEDNDICDLPDVKDKDCDWLDWFFTRDPEVVVETIALQELKAESNLKANVLQKMKDYKDSKDNLILLDQTIYGNGQEFCRANTRGRAERILTLGFSLFPTRSLITSTSINPLMTIGDL